VTSNSTDTRTSVEELSAAAQKLRDGNRFLGADLSTYDRDYLAWLGSLVASTMPLATWLESEADRWDAEITTSQVDCANCYTTADCIDPHIEARYHEQDCERVFEAPTDENRDADWRCDCFDNSIAVARAINGTAK
jgi:hypothetical protein